MRGWLPRPRGSISAIAAHVGGLLLAAAALSLNGVAAHAQMSAAAIPTDDLGANCNRACLIDVMDRYLAAMIAHDPKQAPFGTYVKFSENGVVLPVGTALWRTMSGLGTFKQYVVDPRGGAIGFLGTIYESGQHEILSVRLKLNDRVIVEAEQMVVRGGGNIFDPAAWEDRSKPGSQRKYTTASWNDVLKRSERVPRDRMIAVANSYFQSIQGGAASPVPFSADCHRIENGTVTIGTATSGPDVASSPGGGKRPPMTCWDELSQKGMFSFNTEIRDRRHLIVDEETGIVWSHVFFDHAATAPTGANGQKRPFSRNSSLPNSLTIDELFWIRNGVIRHIAVNLMSVPFGSRSGWEVEGR